MKSTTFLSFISLSFLMMVLIACDPDRVYEENVNVPDQTWSRENLLVFKVSIADTVHPHNIYINIRNGGQYEFSNLYLFVRTISPAGQWVRDTVECILADERGKWLGGGIGDIYDLQIPYKRNIRFPYKGIYTFEYEQAMRIEKLHHILDVGLRVEKIN